MTRGPVYRNGRVPDFRHVKLAFGSRFNEIGAIPGGKFAWQPQSVLPTRRTDFARHILTGFRIARPSPGVRITTIHRSLMARYRGKDSITRSQRRTTVYRPADHAATEPVLEGGCEFRRVVAFAGLIDPGAYCNAVGGDGACNDAGKKSGRERGHAPLLQRKPQGDAETFELSPVWQSAAARSPKHDR